MKSKRRHDDDNGDDSDDSASSINSKSYSDESRRERRRSKKKRKKHDRRKSKKSKKRKKSHRKERRRDDDDDSSESTRSRKRHKKTSKKEKKRSRRNIHEAETSAPSRNDVLAQALHHLLGERLVFSQELPLILIRLAGGATFDLTQMTDRVAAGGLQSVFEALESFGVKQNLDGQWMFQPPPGRRDELLLLRVIRSLLDEIGLTMEAIDQYETQQKQQPESTVDPIEDTKIKTPQSDGHDEELEKVKELTGRLLTNFQKQDAQLGTQLAGLCKAIAEGESISIEGLPDAKLKDALEAIFTQCGLEKSEMEDSDDDDDDDEDEDDEPLMGYGLPDEDIEHVQEKLATVMAVCRNPPQRRVLGPARRGPAAVQESSEEDEGPLPVGEAARQARGPTLPPEVIKAQAQRRELELKAAAAGVSMASQEGTREEWMLIPGKFDFLSNIKSGHAIKSRGFQNKKSGGQDKVVAMHPSIQAEVDKIMAAHNEARGPSLMDQHRAKKLQEKIEAEGKTKEWKWSRDKDLDAGRRVDKDALKMVLGGAKDNLKTKFQGGWR